MDAAKFDSLTRSLGRRVTRRAVLQAEPYRVRTTGGTVWRYPTVLV